MKPDLEKRITELEKIVKQLQASASIPLGISNAFQSRVGLTDTSVPVFSQAVNEGGSSSYTVAKTYDGMKLDKDGRYFGFYNSQ